MEKKIVKFGTPEQGAIEQAENCLDEAVGFALMGDNHKGYGMPVGGVAVYKDKICPAGVGFDIACGNKAVKLNLKLSEIEDKLPRIAQQIFDTISFGIGQKNDIKINHPLFEDTAWNVGFLASKPELKKKAQDQLGTIGSGNHYVDVFVDEEDYIWVGVHFGSRGLGHTIASHFMELAGDNPNIMDETPHCLDVNSLEGQDYLRCMELAGRYAYAGRDWVCDTVAKIIYAYAGVHITERLIIDEVHNHHNFAWKEKHNGEDYYVVRKGATPAFPGQRGFVGSTMADMSVILKGIDSPRSKEAFYSTVHGAGRVMSRTEAAGKMKFKNVYECGNRNCDGWEEYRELGQNEGKPKCSKCGSKTNKRKKRVRVSEGKINFEEVQEMMHNKGIILKGAGADEAPGAYKKLEDVLKEHEGTIQVLHRLKPLIVCMAGEETFDPYKD